MLQHNGHGHLTRAQWEREKVKGCNYPSATIGEKHGLESVIFFAAGLVHRRVRRWGGIFNLEW